MTPWGLLSIRYNERCIFIFIGISCREPWGAGSPQAGTEQGRSHKGMKHMKICGPGMGMIDINPTCLCPTSHKEARQEDKFPPAHRTT
jgi:hypothetical protein